MTLTEIIARLEELEGKATPTPWKLYKAAERRVGSEIVRSVSMEYRTSGVTVDEFGEKVDGDYGGLDVVNGGWYSEKERRTIDHLEADSQLLFTLRTHARTLIAAGKCCDAMRKIAAYPPVGGRRTDDGYPSEIVYDEFAHKRMVASYREAINAALAELDRAVGGKA